MLTQRRDFDNMWWKEPQPVIMLSIAAQMKIYAPTYSIPKDANMELNRYTHAFSFWTSGGHECIYLHEPIDSIRKQTTNATIKR